MKSVDVVIVGGGISGLATARGLAGAGCSVRLFEARGRIGGRLESVAVPGGVADMGASWFWPGEERVRALVDEFGLRVHPQWTEGDGLFVTADGVQRLDGNPIDVPAFRLSDGAATLAERLADGLPDGVAETSRIVHRVEQASSGVDVLIDNETVRCAAVVLALPPALVISSGMLDPDQLDQRMGRVVAETPVWMGSTVKAVAVYEEAFWRLDGLAGSAI
ncbi:MAG: flavin monoamine oxidase family protein, partial [Acidimicrobiales bacterium]